MLNHTNFFVARILRQGCNALAAYACDDFLRSQPEVNSDRGRDALDAWRCLLAERLRELAAALAAGDPEIFTRQVVWARTLLNSKGFSTDDFRESLVCLQNVLDRQLPEHGRPLATEYLSRALSSFEEDPPPSSFTLQPKTAPGRLAAQYLVTLLQGDSRRAGQLILDAVGDNHTVQELLVRVLLPAQVEVGRMWHAGEVNIAEEHLVTATTKTVMAQLMSLAECRPSNGKTVLMAAVAGNHIDIGLQAVADFFEMDGWRAIQLGANVPTADVVEAIDCFEADLLGLSASQSTQLETVREAITALRDSFGETVGIVVGGFGFTGSEHLATDLGADGYGCDPAAAVEFGRQLLASDRSGRDRATG